MSGYIHRADKDFDLYAGNLCGGTDDTTIVGIYGRYKADANTIHGRYAKRTCDTAAEPSSIKLEYVRGLSDNARIRVSHEVFDGDTATGIDVNKTQVGFRYDF